VRLTDDSLMMTLHGCYSALMTHYRYIQIFIVTNTQE